MGAGEIRSRKGHRKVIMESQMGEMGFGSNCVTSNVHDRCKYPNISSSS